MNNDKKNKDKNNKLNNNTNFSNKRKDKENIIINLNSKKNLKQKSLLKNQKKNIVIKNKYNLFLKNFYNLNVKLFRTNISYIIDKNSYPHKIWKIIYLILIFYSVTIIPLYLIFKQEILVINIIEFFLDFFLLINFIKNFFAVENINKNTSLKMIIKNYWITWFIVDLITSIPYSIIIYILSYFFKIKFQKLIFYLNVFKFLRFFIFLKYLNYFVIIITFNIQIKSTYKRFIKLIFNTLIFFHNTTCLWIFFGYIDINENNWIKSNNLEFSSIEILYLYAYYWSAQTVYTVGYGDIGSYNVHEKLISIIIMFLGVFFSSFFISSLTSIFFQIDKINNKNDYNKIILKSWFNKYNLPNQLYRKILLFIKQNSLIEEKEMNFLQELKNNKLKNELIFEMNYVKIKNIFFFKNKSKNFITFLIPYLKFIHYNKGDYIFNEKEISYEIYFIKKGKVSITKEFDGRYINIALLTNNQYFGDLELISGNCLRLFSAIAINDVLVWAIPYNFADKIFFNYFPNEGIKLIKKSVKKKINYFNIFNNKKLNFKLDKLNYFKNSNFKKFLINQITNFKISNKNLLNLKVIHYIFLIKIKYLQIKNLTVLLSNLKLKKKKKLDIIHEIDLLLNN